MNEIQNVYLHIIQTFMVRSVEVPPYLTLGFIVANVVEMRLESVHETIFFVCSILYAATFA